MVNTTSNSLRNYISRIYHLHITDEGAWDVILANCKRDLYLSIQNSLRMIPSTKVKLCICKKCKSVLNKSYNHYYCVVCRQVVSNDEIVPISDYIA